MTDPKEVSEFREELERWRAEHPGWTEDEQLRAFSPFHLWTRAGGCVLHNEITHADDELYRDLMIAAGYVVPRRPGDDGNLPCGWPGR